MKPLDFGRYSSTEWREFKRIHGAMFWDEVERRVLEEARRMLQARVYEEFEVQIGAKRYERVVGRLDGVTTATHAVITLTLPGLPVCRST